MDLQLLCEMYNDSIISGLDMVAPLTEVKVRRARSCPWMSPRILEMIRLRRTKERKWRQSRNEYDWLAFVSQRKYTQWLIRQTKQTFFASQFADIKYDAKEVFKRANKILFRVKNDGLPKNDDRAAQAKEFNDFFIGKIATIRATIDLKMIPPETVLKHTEQQYTTSHRFNRFGSLTDDDVLGLISKSATKSCSMDPGPTSIIKEHRRILLPLIRDIVNTSLQTGELPDSMKLAKVKPLIKKAGLDNLIKKNFRPVSNLTYLSKLIEGAVVVQMDENVSLSGNQEPLQSAYRCAHSTETALIKVREDILESLDRQEICCLILLDLSAAFDTLDVSLILNRLKYRYGFGGVVLKWLECYLSGRRQSVEIDGVSSDPGDLSFGVPQGSLLGPKIFSNFVAPVGEICRRHGVNFHGYADDTQNYASFKVSVEKSRELCFRKLEDCVAEISEWMVVNKLKLNEDKTEFMVFGTRQQLSSIHLPLTINICGEQISSEGSVRNLGFWFDECMTNVSHVNRLVQSSYLMLKNIRSVRYKLDQDTTHTLVRCLIISKIDYCNALLLGTSKYHLTKLQKILNMGCRLILGLKSRDSITIHLKELHWLKIDERIDYKIIMIVFKSINKLAPVYLQEMFVRPKKSALRSSSKGDLFVGRTNRTGLMKRSIRFAGSRL